MIKYIIQIDMAEFGDAPLWEDVSGAVYDDREKAYNSIAWLKEHYGDLIEYRVLARVWIDCKQPVAQNYI